MRRWFGATDPDTSVGKTDERDDPFVARRAHAVVAGNSPIHRFTGRKYVPLRRAAVAACTRLEGRQEVVAMHCAGVLDEPPFRLLSVKGWHAWCGLCRGTAHEKHREPSADNSLPRVPELNCFTYSSHRVELMCSSYPGLERTRSRMSSTVPCRGHQLGAEGPQSTRARSELSSPEALAPCCVGAVGLWPATGCGGLSPGRS